jgi:hypothetical protein
MHRVTLVLPLDDTSATAPAALAPRAISLSGLSLGVVDNGLWRSMRRFTDLLRSHAATSGAAGVETVPFDHLAPDFGDQQRALGPFGRRVRGVVTGLGN